MKRSTSSFVIVPSITSVSPAVSANGGSDPCCAAHVNNFVRFSHVMSIVAPWLHPLRQYALLLQLLNVAQFDNQIVLGSSVPSVTLRMLAGTSDSRRGCQRVLTFIAAIRTVLPSLTSACLVSTILRIADRGTGMGCHGVDSQYFNSAEPLPL
jgi:hypothetical protein